MNFSRDIASNYVWNFESQDRQRASSQIEKKLKTMCYTFHAVLPAKIVCTVGSGILDGHDMIFYSPLSLFSKAKKTDFKS